MLVQLSISNFAIIDRLTVDLGVGFSALTGETGAGKSIIIDAMSAMLGAKIGPEFVRHGTPTARVEGLFDLTKLDPASVALLRRRQIDAGLIAEDEPDAGDTSLTLSREIHSSGRTVARVNGTLVNVATLQAVGELLVDIHGQTEHQSLLRVPTHLDLLDQYAHLGPDRERMFELVTRIRAVRKERESLQRDERELARRADLLQFQVDEIDKAELEPGEDEELARERVRLINSERLGSLADSIYAILIEGSGDDEYGGGRGGKVARGGRGGMPQAVANPVRDALSECAALLDDLLRLDPMLKDDEGTLAGLIDTVEELGRKVRHYREGVEHDPERLMQVEERVSLLHELKRKYGPSIDDVIEFGRQAAKELDTITHSEERIADLQAEEDELLERAGVLAESMSQRRAEAGKQLAASVEEAMRQLLMGSIKFATSITRQPDPHGIPAPNERGEEGRWAFDTRGIDRVEFLISPNPGEPLKPLSKIASGGETARLMLAMKSILSNADHTPTLIFDEVDAGVGGRSGQVVGEKLWSLTDHHQVICISHLPQIAAFADAHYKITKLVNDGRTSTRVDRLDPSEQVVEVAAMLGGTPVSNSSLENAREIIHQADEAKVEMRGAAPKPATRRPALRAVR